MTTVLFDNMLLGGQEPRAAALWAGSAERLKAVGIEVFVLDRGATSLGPSVRSIPFPAYQLRNTAAESILIQSVCDHFKVDVFATGGISTPLSTPMILCVDPVHCQARPPSLQPTRQELEAETAVAFAQIYLATSASVITALRERQPEIPLARTVIVTDGECPSDGSVSSLAATVETLATEAAAGRYVDFFEEWTRLRTLQAGVDY